MRCSYSVAVNDSIFKLERYVNVPFRIIYIERFEVISYKCSPTELCAPTVKYVIVKEICEEGEK